MGSARRNKSLKQDLVNLNSPCLETGLLKLNLVVNMTSRVDLVTCS